MVLERLVAWWSAGRHGWVFVATMMIALASCAPAGAVDLKVDIGVADVPIVVSNTPNDVQSGFGDFSPDPAGSHPVFGTDVSVDTPLVSRVFSGVTVSIQGGGDGPTYFDWLFDVSGAQGDLVEDGVFIVNADLFVTIAGLPAGLYEITSFHHSGDLPGTTPFDIFLDAGAGELMVASDVVPSFGFISPPVSTATYQFSATGADDVIIRIEGFVVASSRVPLLNGFTVTLVPEPSSWVLLALGTGGLLGVGRLRRRQARGA